MTGEPARDHQRDPGGRPRTYRFGGIKTRLIA